MPLRFRCWVLAICAVLVTAQFMFLSGPGIQEDEALFVTPFLRNSAPLFSWHIFGFNIPLMSMSYLGTLKSWLYWPIFSVWPPSVWSIRIPACVLSVVTLLLFADLVYRISNIWVAVSASLFLSTDALFVLTNVFDMTVCLLLFGTVGFVSLLHRFTASGHKAYLGTAFFVAGLCLWYKAIFVFPLAGLLLAFMLVYPRESRRYLTAQNLLLVAGSVSLGSAPLIAFNVSHAAATFKASANLPSAPLSEKIMMARYTLDGRAMEHYMFRSSLEETLSLQGAPLGKLVLTWYRQSRFQPGSALLPSVVLAFFALPVLHFSFLFRPLLFGWSAFAVAFVLMLLIPGAGSGPHHMILIYPAPHFIVAATGAALYQRLRHTHSSKLSFVAFCVLVASSNVWLLCQYFYAARSNGFSVYWTDGVRSLAQVIRSEGLPVVFLDWGIVNGVRIETHDAITLVDDPGPRENTLYVTHCDGYVIDKSRWKDFERLLTASGLHVGRSRVVPDKKGRAIFYVFQLAKPLNERQHGDTS